MKKTLRYILVLLTMMLTTQAWAQNVAKIGDQEYATLADAITNADPGAIIEVIADVTELQNGSELSITKSLTITGATNSAGEPLYTIFGKNTATGYNDIFINGSGTVTLSNLNIRQFGNQASTDSGHAPVYVSKNFTGTVNLTNLHISEFNRGGIFLCGGTFNVTKCDINCANSTSGAFTKGIQVMDNASGTIKECVIYNMERSSTTYSCAGIEIMGAGSVLVEECMIMSNVGTHSTTKGTYGIVSSRVGEHDASGGYLKVKDTTIDVTNGCLTASDNSEYGPLNDYTIEVDDCDFNSYILANSATSTITVNSGSFADDVWADRGTILIKGGSFANFTPTEEDGGEIIISGGTFDANVSDVAPYLADGYILGTDTEGNYTAEPEADAVAQIGSTKYASIPAAFAAVQNGETITMLDDVSLTDMLDLTLGSKSVTLDLGGKTLTGRTNLKSGNLTIQNGTVAGGAAQALNVYGSATPGTQNYSVLTIADDVTVTADVYGVCLFGPTYNSKPGYGAVINIAGTVTTTGDSKNGAVFVSGNLGQNIAGDMNNVINITGSITSATDAAIALNGNATVNVKSGAAITGNTAIAIKRGVLNVEDGATVHATGANNIPAPGNNNGTEMTGAAVSMTNTYNQYGSMAVNISGGTFTSDNAVALYKEEDTYANAATYSVSGGTFSSAVPEEFCAESYLPKDNGDGTYTVEQGAIVKFEYATGLLGLTGDATPDIISAVTVGGTSYTLDELRAGVLVLQAATEVNFTFVSPFIPNRTTFQVSTDNGSTWAALPATNTTSTAYSDFGGNYVASLATALTADATYRIQLSAYTANSPWALSPATTSTNPNVVTYVSGDAVGPTVQVLDKTKSTDFVVSGLDNFADLFTITGTQTETYPGNYTIVYTPKAGSPYYVATSSQTFYWKLVKNTKYQFTKSESLFGGTPEQDPVLSDFIESVSDVEYSTDAAEGTYNKVSVTFKSGFGPSYASWTCTYDNHGTATPVNPTSTVINGQTVTFTFPAATVQYQTVTINLSAYGPHLVALQTENYEHDGNEHSLNVLQIVDDVAGVTLTDASEIETFLTTNFGGTFTKTGTDVGYYAATALTGVAGTKYHGAALNAGFAIYEQTAEDGNTNWLNVGGTAPATGNIYYVGSSTETSALGLNTSETNNTLFKVSFGAQATKGTTYWGDGSTVENGKMTVKVESTRPGLKITKVVLTDAGSGNHGANQAPGVTATGGSTTSTGLVYQDYMNEYPGIAAATYVDAKSFLWTGTGASDVTFSVDDAQRVSYIWIEYEKRGIDDLTQVQYNKAPGVTGLTTALEGSGTLTDPYVMEFTNTELFPLAATNTIKDKIRTTTSGASYYLTTPADYSFVAGTVPPSETTMTGVAGAQKLRGRYVTDVVATDGSNVYYNTHTIYWLIRKSITSQFITVKVDPAIYTGEEYDLDAVKALVHVYDYDPDAATDEEKWVELTEGTHYTLAFRTGHESCLEAETYDKELILTGIEAEGLYGIREVDFTISPVEVITTRVKASVEYTGNAITMSDLVAPDPDNIPADFTGKLIVEGVTGTDGVTGEPIWTVLTYGTDYTAELVAQEDVTYKEAGLYPSALKIKAMEGGNYTSISNGDLIIWKSYDVTKGYAADFTVDEIPTQFIGGNHNEATPDVVLKDNDKQLTKDVDYTLTYADNMAQGVATITINAIPLPVGTDFDTRVYRDSRELTFNISNMEFTEDGITYIMTSSDDVAVINIEPDGTTGEKVARVVVPATVDHVIVADPETKVTFTVKAINEGGLSYPELISAILPATIETVQNGAFAQSSNVRWIDMQTAANFTPSTLERTIAAAPFAGVSKAALIFLNGTTVSGENYIYNTGSGLRCDELKIYEDMTGDQLGYADANGYKWGFENPYEFQANTVTNTRQLNATNTEGKQQGYTLCLPYSLPIPEGIDAYVLSASKTDLLGFMPFSGNTLEALMPYVILPNASGQLLSTTNATIVQTYLIGEHKDASLPFVASSAVDGQEVYLMGGVMRYMDGETCAASDTKTYIMQSGNVWRPITGGSYTDADNKACILPMRAIIIPTPTAIGPHGAPALQSVFGMPGSSDMDIFEHIDIDAEDGQYFDLQGRPVATPDRGVYIRNGKKVVIK